MKECYGFFIIAINFNAHFGWQHEEQATTFSHAWCYAQKVAASKMMKCCDATSTDGGQGKEKSAENIATDYY